MEGGSSSSRRFAGWILSHRRALLVVFVLLFIVTVSLSPIAQVYVSNSSATTLPSSDQSVQVQNLVPTNASLSVVTPNLFTQQQFCNVAYGFAQGLAAQEKAGDISDYASTVSVCSVGAATVDSLFGSGTSANATRITTNRSEFEDLSNAIWGYPNTFLTGWELNYYDRAAINLTFNETGGSWTGYDNAFRASLYQNYSSTELPEQNVEGAVLSTAFNYFNNETYGDRTTSKTLIVVAGVIASPLGVPGYADSVLIDNETATWLGTFGGWLDFTLAGSMGGSVVQAYSGGPTSDPGWNFVQHNGYEVDIFPPSPLVPAGFPVVLPTVLSQFLNVRAGNTTMLVAIIFSVSSSYVGSDGSTPSQLATPTVRNVAIQYFGAGAGVAGAGATLSDLGPIDHEVSLILFVTFFLITIATVIVLRSFWAGALSLILVFFGLEGLSQIGILAGGLLTGSVPTQATQILEFLIVGLVTDYLVYMTYRYRQEIVRGADPHEAIHTAAETAGFAILTSATIVAIGLLTLSVEPSVRAYGPVLAISVILTGISVAVFLPMMISFIGPRLFIRQYLVPSTKPIEQSPFYRFAHAAIRRRVLVVVIAAIVAVPAIAFLFTAPLSYNTFSGLPSNLPSVQASNQITAAFGPSQIYPTTVLVRAPTGTSFCNATDCNPAEGLNPANVPLLVATANDLRNASGVSGAVGPFIDQTTTYNASAPENDLTLRVAFTSFTLDNGTWADYTVYLANDPYSLSAMSTVQSLRGNTTWLVGGTTAQLVDQQAQNNMTFPVVYGLIVLLIGIILAVAFRSLAFPLISLSGVWVSIGSSFVLLWWVSQYLLNQVVLYIIPLLLIVILLSLGNDYTVFTLSRVAEERKRYPKNEAIARAAAESGPAVVALGVMLAMSLGALAFAPLPLLTQLGIVFAVSLILDTFLIIMFYFPAAISLFTRK